MASTEGLEKVLLPLKLLRIDGLHSENLGFGLLGLVESGDGDLFVRAAIDDESLSSLFYFEIDGKNLDMI